MVMGKSLLDTKSLAYSNFCYEQSLITKGFAQVAGCDEAGRGPLAGPVVAASVILPVECNTSVFVDSKKLTHLRRVELHRLLQDINAAIGIGVVSVEKIDEINILQASLLAMRRSVDDLSVRNFTPDFILVDGKFEIPLATPQQALIKGESKSASIAAASIVAKITRDSLMDDLHEMYPNYNFKKHKGYPTREHRQAIAAFGPCSIHRRTFRGVKEFVK